MKVQHLLMSATLLCALQAQAQVLGGGLNGGLNGFGAVGRNVGATGALQGQGAFASRLDAGDAESRASHLTRRAEQDAATSTAGAHERAGRALGKSRTEAAAAAATTAGAAGELSQVAAGDSAGGTGQVQADAPLDTQRVAGNGALTGGGTLEGLHTAPAGGEGPGAKSSAAPVASGGRSARGEPAPREGARPAQSQPAKAEPRLPGASASAGAQAEGSASLSH